MKNRAKCKLCNEIIESKSHHDFVSCSCGRLKIDGGTSLPRIMFGKMRDFCYLDDDGNEYHFPGIKIPFPEEEWIHELNGYDEFYKHLKHFLMYSNFPGGTVESVLNLLNGYKKCEIVPNVNSVKKS